MLRGATQLLERERPNVLIEVEEAHPSRENMDQVFAFMVSRDYEGSFWMGGVRHPLEDLDREATRRRGERQKSMGMLRTAVARDE